MLVAIFAFDFSELAIAIRDNLATTNGVFIGHVRARAKALSIKSVLRFVGKDHVEVIKLY
jgi:hypothetical protein